MTLTTNEVITDTWINLTWSEYLNQSEKPEHHKAKFYYYQGKGKIEMSPLGNFHSRDHYFLIFALNLFATLNNISLDGHDNCTYRKGKTQEAQPDLSFYIGENADSIPYSINLINLDEYPAPNLVIEVANSSLADDLGNKRLLYEDLGVEEYWVIDVNQAEIIAFKMANNGSYRITQSQLLTGLEINVLNEALKMSRQTNHTEVSLWLFDKIKNN
jgi:Uma2 family endonuclease